MLHSPVSDGTPGGYYWAPASWSYKAETEVGGAQNNIWIIYLEGGRVHTPASRLPPAQFQPVPLGANQHDLLPAHHAFDRYESS